MLNQIFSTDELADQNSRNSANVAGALRHGAGDGAVNRDVLSGDVFENALVGGGSAADVVIRLQSVNGNRDLETRQGSPMMR